MQSHAWLAMELDKVQQDAAERQLCIEQVIKTSAPKKQQGENGLWRVVRVHRKMNSYLLTAAWQPLP